LRIGQHGLARCKGKAAQGIGQWLCRQIKRNAAAVARDCRLRRHKHSCCHQRVAIERKWVMDVMVRTSLAPRKGAHGRGDAVRRNTRQIFWKKSVRRAWR
jgi:hypothetical protein